VSERLAATPLEQHLQALQHGDHVDRNEIQKLMVEVRQAALQLHEEVSTIDRARLEEEWKTSGGDGGANAAHNAEG